MMLRAVFGMVILGVGLAGVDAAAQPTSHDVLLELSRARLRAVDAGDKAAFATGLDPEGLFADEDGVVRTGAALLEEVRPLPSGYVGKLEMREPQVRVSGDVAVVTYGIAERLDLFGQRLNTRYHTTDVYQRRTDAWRLIASHTSVIPGELPRIALPPARMTDYVGRYRLGEGPTAEVRVDGARLLFEREGRPAQELVPTGRDRFAQAGRPRVERLFTRDAAGVVDSGGRRPRAGVILARVAHQRG
ncbi:MAG: DUF4440 domain-containing protein [Vicinamibacteraceae bacterium]